MGLMPLVRLLQKLRNRKDFSIMQLVKKTLPTEPRLKKMPAYIHKKKILHINRYRRRGKGLPYGTGSKEVGADRRRKVRDGIIL